MNQFIHFIENMNPWLTIVGLIATMLFGILSVVFYFKGAKEKKPAYKITTTNVISNSGNKFKSLKVLYSGKEIPNFSTSKVIFWNAGRETINSQDVVHGDPLRIKVKEGYTILDAKVIKVTNETNGFDIEKNDTEVKFSFDYIDNGDAILVEVLHTGEGEEDINLIGRFKGVKQLKRIKQVTIWRVFFVAFFAGITSSSIMNGFKEWPVELVLLVWMLLGLYFFKKKEIPKELRKFK